MSTTRSSPIGDPVTDRTGRGRWVRSLRVRLALGFTILLIAVLFGLTFVMGMAIQRVSMDRLSNELVDQARVTAYAVSLVEPGRSSSTEMAALVEELGALGDTRLTLIDVDGVVLADSMYDPAILDNYNDRPDVVNARKNNSGRSSSMTHVDSEAFLYVAIVVPGGDGHVLRSAAPLRDVEVAVDAFQQASLVAVLVAASLSAIASWWLAGRAVRPLERLRAHANRVGAGDFCSRLAPVDLREVDEVGQAFNVMTAALERSLDEQARVTLRLEAVMDGLADGVVLTDEQGHVLRMNPAAAALLNVDEVEMASMPFLQVTRDHEIAQVLQTSLAGDSNVQAVIAYGLQQQTLQISASTLKGANERLGLAVVRDVTELHRLENVRREFVANVSHELRTPLTSIRALVETLEAGVIDDKETAADFLARIVAEVERLNGLVEDLLDFARLEAGRAPLQVAKQDIGQTVRRGADRLKPQIERAGLTLTFDIPSGLPDIAIDSDRIEQVLLNLIHNAIKFTPSPGEIIVSVARQDSDIMITVADTGVGIQPAEQDRLFERFYKSDRARRTDGTGLGLAIAKHIVQLHGGTLWVQSAPGEGAVFAFTLPLRGKKARRRARRHVAGLG